MHPTPNANATPSAAPAQPADLVCQPLAQQLEHLPTVAAWMVAEWPAWYGPGGPGDVQADLQAYAATAQGLPMGLLASGGGVPLGFAALKVEAFLGRPAGTVWAGAAVVAPTWRRRGVGLALMQALWAQAQALDQAEVLCATATAVTLMQRAGWRWLETVQHQGQPLQVFCNPPR